MTKFLKIAMVIPTTEGIYAPSRFHPEPVEVSSQVANSRPIRGRVSFAPDGKSNPVKLNFYGYGLSGWYIRLDEAIRAGYQAGYLIQLPVTVAISERGFVEVDAK